jgi:predicted SAM-dependent methyltransferase
MKYLNLACGDRFHKDWINVDFVSSNEFVLCHNLLEGIPFSDNYFDGVYNSHVLGHFSKQQGVLFLKECFRVLKVGGVIRIVVPDLEQLAKEYLTALGDVMNIETEMNVANYEWSVIELIDEMVREKQGGEMLNYWKQKEIINEEHIVKRLGHEFVKVRENIIKNETNSEVQIQAPKDSVRTKIKNYLLKILHVDVKDIQLVEFINSGEQFKWMYDRYSLSRLLKGLGFTDIKVQTADQSYMVDWDKYLDLDMEKGMIRKPDSLFIEAKK